MTDINFPEIRRRITQKYRLSPGRKHGGFIDFWRKFASNATQKRKRGVPNCHPMVAGQGATQTTCYNKDILLKIKRAYNRAHTDTPIPTNDPAEVLRLLRMRMKDRCDQEDCWLKLLPKKQREFFDKEVFAPDKPPEWAEKPNEWLSNFDILAVLAQYEKAYPTFKFIGPSPIDFDKRPPSYGGKCVWNELCQFQLSKYVEKGIEHIGISFNLDEHNKGGSHWVSLFVDIPGRVIFYFDSARNDVPKEVEHLVEKIVDQAKALDLPLEYDYNTCQHQFSNSECGMYSLFFFITLITGKWGGTGREMSRKHALKRFKYQRIPDKTVQEFRNRYFNDP
jgi:hypothetical protein